VDLSAEALAAFEAFRTFLDQLKPDLDGREREWAAKGGTHVLRLSGALAYLDWAMLGGPEPQSVGQQHVEAAVRLWREYFWPHSRAAVRQVGLTEKHANAGDDLTKWPESASAAMARALALLAEGT
jgi:hypothetical protein